MLSPYPSYLLREAKLAKHQAKYDAQIRNAQKMFELMAEFVPARRSSQVPVPEAVVDIWEGVLLDSGCSDVELRTVGSGCGHASIYAHSIVLRRASPVLEPSPTRHAVSIGSNNQIRRLTTR